MLTAHQPLQAECDSLASSMLPPRKLDLEGIEEEVDSDAVEQEGARVLLAAAAVAGPSKRSRKA